MELQEVMAKRRSIRSYQKRRVGKAKLRRLQKALQIAPTGSNKQEFQFIFVTDEKRLQRIARQAGHQDFLAEAPLIVVAVCEPGGEFNVAIAMDHMVLAATNEGLGTCWIGWFEREPVRKILRIPRDKDVAIMVTVGHPGEEPEPRSRKPLEQLISENTYRMPKK